MMMVSRNVLCICMAAVAHLGERNINLPISMSNMCYVPFYMYICMVRSIPNLRAPNQMRALLPHILQGNIYNNIDRHQTISATEVWYINIYEYMSIYSMTPLEFSPPQLLPNISLSERCAAAASRVLWCTTTSSD